MQNYCVQYHTAHIYHTRPYSVPLFTRKVNNAKPKSDPVNWSREELTGQRREGRLELSPNSPFLFPSRPRTALQQWQPSTKRKPREHPVTTENLCRWKPSSNNPNIDILLSTTTTANAITLYVLHFFLHCVVGLFLQCVFPIANPTSLFTFNVHHVYTNTIY